MTHTTLKNGHSLTIIAARYDGAIDREHYAVHEYNELGTRIGIAFGSFDRAECEAWCRRAKQRGYGYHPSAITKEAQA